MSNSFLFLIIGFLLGVLYCKISHKSYGLSASEVKQSAETDIDYVSELKQNSTMWNIFSDALPIHIYIKNADDEFRYVYSNKNRNEYFGKKLDELIGQNDHVLLSKENAQKQLALDAEIMTKPQGIYEGMIETNDAFGNQKYFRIVQTQYTDKNGRRLLLGAAIDITELEESRRLLTETKKLTEERELWLSRTLASIGDAVIVTDKKGNTILLNPVAERMLGVHLNEVVGKPHEEVFQIVGTRDEEPRQSPVGRALRTGVIVELANNTDLISKTGERYHISDSAAPITDENNNILGAVLVFRDVTEVYQRRAALREALNDWELASEVSSIVSFRVDYRTRKISGSRRLPEFWPVINGYAVPPESWVLPEDVSEGQGLMAAVASGKLSNTFYQYRAMKDGKIRHYRIYGAVDQEHPGEITGVIQDMTDAYEKELQLHNTREMWNSLIDVLPLHFFAKNVNESFRYTHCNRRFAEFIGKNIEDIVGKTDAELFKNSGDISHFEEQDRSIVSQGKASNFTENVYGNNSQPTVFQTIKMACIGPTGEELLLGVSIDITDLVKLSKSREVIRQGLEMLVEETDVNEGIIKAMKSICEYIDVSRCFIFHFDIKNKSVSCVREYCSSNEKELFSNIKQISFSTHIDWYEHFKNESIMNFPDLQKEDALCKFGQFYTDLIKKGDLRSLYCHRLIVDGQFWGFVGLAYKKEIRILDKVELEYVQSAARFIELIIRHKRTQESLREAVIQANAAEKAKSIFLATMSHEIRTPLSAVIGYSELLKDGTLPEKEQKDYLKDISIAGNALLALINDILDISKLDAGKMHLAKTETDFSDLVYEISVIFRQKLREKKLTEIMDIADIPMIKIDPLRVRQILFNLFGNAIKFTDQGTITISAHFTPNKNGKLGTLYFSIKDTGCGISKDDCDRLFQPFVQSNTMLGTRKAGCGTGLGLVLVRRMLDLMNGSVSLESTEGVGSVFSVILRNVEYTNNKSKFIIDNKMNEPAISEKMPISRKILIVDDVPMNLKVIKAMLLKLGMETVTVGNADAALAELKKQPFDILLTDLWMPGMNGLEMAEKIRHSGKYPDMGIVIVTADTEVGINYDSKTFDMILTKPITFEKLRHFIGKFSKK